MRCLIFKYSGIFYILLEYFVVIDGNTNYIVDLQLFKNEI